MPGFDRTGPEGKGPKTGLQMGNCKGAEPVRGRGMGMGCRERRFRRRFFVKTPLRETDNKI